MTSPFRILALIVLSISGVAGQPSAPKVASPQIIGCAAIKEQTFHEDASANVVGYVKLTDDGWSTVKIDTGRREFTMDRKLLVGRLETLASMPLDISNDSEIRPLRDALTIYQDFLKRFPKSKPLLNNNITALTGCIKAFEGGKVRINGEWTDRETIAENQRKADRESIERDMQLAIARGQARRQQQERDTFARLQRENGLEEYRGEWLPKDEVQRHVKEDRIAKIEADTKARIAADAQALAAQAQAKAAASMAMLRGTVIDFTSEGMLVDSNYGSVNMPDAIKDPKGRPELKFGHFFLTGHPEQKNKVNDSWFDVDAIYDGVFEYTTVLGATRRVHRFRVAKAYY